MALGNDYTRPVVGWLAGCMAATIAIYLLWCANAAIAQGSPVVVVAGILFFVVVAPPIFIVVLIFSGLPAAILIALSEAGKIRSILYFGCGGAAIGALSQFLLSAGFLPLLPKFSLLFVVAGFAAGSAYWFVAGKYAGADCPASSAST
jgi:hypothetical protein